MINLFKTAFIYIFLLNNTAIVNASNLSVSEFELLLKPKNILILEEFNKIAKREKVIKKKNQHYVPGSISTKDDNLSISIRPDGLGEEHFNNNSFLENTYKVRTKENIYINRMKEFRLVHPKSVRYDIPLIFNIIFDEINHPNPKKEVVKVNLQLKGDVKNLIENQTLNWFPYNKFANEIMFMEEDINKDFLERNFLREGILFKRDIINSNAIEIHGKCRNQLIDESICREEFKKITNKALLKQTNKSKNLKQRDYAFRIFQEYMNGLESPSNVFDYNKTIDFFIIHSIWNNGHSSMDHNTKFYFNPITKLITPIPTDPFHPMRIKSSIIAPFNIKEWKFLDEIEYVYKNRDNAINWFDNLVADETFQNLYFEKLESFLLNDNLIEQLKVKTSDLLFEDTNHYYFGETSGGTALGVFFENLDKMRTAFQNPDIKEKLKEKRLIFEMQSLKNKKSFHNIILNIDHEKKLISISGNDILISKDIIIPRLFDDYTFTLENNQTLELTNNAKIIIRSNFTCQGDEDNINRTGFKSQHNSNSHILFMGQKTLISNCFFDGFRSRNPFLTSAITFHETSASIINSKFTNFDAEDMINIVFSDFEIIDSEFYNSTSDLIDVDKGSGRIENVKIAKCDNDCLDLSGSQVEINNLRVDESKDKGISIGENSLITLNQSSINNCILICIAVKDESKLMINNSSLSNGKIGIADYVKKNIYKEPDVVAKNVSFININIETYENYPYGK